jgi:hypothetical protein
MAFQTVLVQADAFRTAQAALFPQVRLTSFDEAVGILQTCGAMLVQAGDLPRRRESALQNCRAAARLIRESLVFLDPSVLIGQAGAAVQAPAAPALPVATQPLPGAAVLPEIKLPENPTIRTVEQLSNYLEKLQGFQIVQPDEEPEDPNAPWVPVSEMQRIVTRVAAVLTDWEDTYQNLMDGFNADGSEPSRPRNPSETQIEGWESRQEALALAREALENQPIDQDDIATAIEELSNFE